MKTILIIIILLFLSGCNTKQDYNEGYLDCREDINTMIDAMPEHVFGQLMCERFHDDEDMLEKLDVICN